jgi:hypothetical protein
MRVPLSLHPHQHLLLFFLPLVLGFELRVYNLEPFHLELEFHELLPKLASNHDPPDLCILIS